MSTFLPLNSGTSHQSGIVYRIKQNPQRVEPVRRHEVQALARKLRKEGIDAVVIGQPKETEESKFLPLLPLPSIGLGLATGKLAQERKKLEEELKDTREWDQEKLKGAKLDWYV